MERSRGLAWMSAIGVCLMMSLAAEAAEVRARCDYQAGRRERSKIAVDVKDLVISGSYTTTVTTKNGGQTSGTDAVTLPNDEAEFDFDSNAANATSGTPRPTRTLGVSTSVPGRPPIPAM